MERQERPGPCPSLITCPHRLSTQVSIRGRHSAMTHSRGGHQQLAMMSTLDLLLSKRCVDNRCEWVFVQRRVASDCSTKRYITDIVRFGSDDDGVTFETLYLENGPINIHNNRQTSITSITGSYSTFRIVVTSNNSNGSAPGFVCEIGDWILNCAPRPPGSWGPTLINLKT
eukprot:scaffold291367_cov41-Tisochrysis_lutea.AAC.1